MHLPEFTMFPSFAQTHGSVVGHFISWSLHCTGWAGCQPPRADPCCSGTDCDSAMLRAAELAASHRCCLGVPVVGHLHLISQPSVSRCVAASPPRSMGHARQEHPVLSSPGCTLPAQRFPPLDLVKGEWHSEMFSVSWLLKPLSKRCGSVIWLSRFKSLTFQKGC